MKIPPVINFSKTNYYLDSPCCEWVFIKEVTEEKISLPRSHRML